MRRILMVAAGASLAAAASVFVGVGPAAADDYYSESVPAENYEYEIQVTPEMEAPPPWCPSGNTFIVLNGLCLRLS